MVKFVDILVGEFNYHIAKVCFDMVYSILVAISIIYLFTNEYIFEMDHGVRRYSRL
jgi:hypothetical protein